MSPTASRTASLAAVEGSVDGDEVGAGGDAVAGAVTLEVGAVTLEVGATGVDAARSGWRRPRRATARGEHETDAKRRHEALNAECVLPSHRAIVR